MSGLENYGLRVARKLIRALRPTMKGREAYARGYRNALTELDSAIAYEIAKNREAAGLDSITAEDGNQK